MFAKTIIDSDAFIDMPTTTRLLYYDLAMRADDDGFINSPKKICRMTGASDDDLKILALKKFIIPFESGVVVIKHWKIHNYIRKDTYIPTKYGDEMKTLSLDENKSYTQRPLPVDGTSTQDRLGEDRIGEYKLGKGSVVEERGTDTTENPQNTQPLVENSDNEIKQFKGRVYLSENQIDSLIDEMGILVFDIYVDRLDNWLETKNITISGHADMIREWYREDLPK